MHVKTAYGSLVELFGTLPHMQQYMELPTAIMDMLCCHSKHFKIGKNHIFGRINHSAVDGAADPSAIRRHCYAAKCICDKNMKKSKLELCC